MDDWGWQQLAAWRTCRLEPPVGTLLCIINASQRRVTGPASIRAASAPTRARRRDGPRRSPAQRHSTPARPREPRRHLRLSAGHRHQRDRGHRPIKTRTRPASERCPPRGAPAHPDGARPVAAPAAAFALERVHERGVRGQEVRRRQRRRLVRDLVCRAGAGAGAGAGGRTSASSSVPRRWPEERPLRRSLAAYDRTALRLDRAAGVPRSVGVRAQRPVGL